MKPEENERLAALLLCNFHNGLEVCFSFHGVAVINVGYESKDADNGALAFSIINGLLDQLMHIRLNVSLVEKFICKGGNATSFTWSIILLLARLRFAHAIVPVENGRVTLDLESGAKLGLNRGVNLGKLDFALQLGRSLVPLGLESLAVTTPRSVELNKPNIFGAENSGIEVSVSENNHIFVIG